LIEEIIISTNKGIPIFYHNFHGKSADEADYQIIYSYLDQICRWANFGFKRNVNSMKFKNCLMLFYHAPRNEINLVIKCDKQIDKIKNLRKVIDNIAEMLITKFIIKYKNNLINFSGNVTEFKSFSNQINEVILNNQELMDYRLRNIQMP
jgi:hypothetical protein